MARGKIKKGSTFVDMTAMCDVAFLLLTFFILATQFKPSEAVNVTPPSSVSTKHAPQKDYFNVTISKDNEVFIDMDEGMRVEVLENVAKQRNLSFSPEDMELFKRSNYVGVPLNQLKQYIRLNPEEAGNVKMQGIPTDSTNNELLTWVTAAVNVSQGKIVNFLIKGDNSSMYTTFSNVIEAFKKNDVYKYNLVTNAADIPQGSELWKKNMAGLMGKEVE
ncbi:MAG: biopolymer transporter ExbD [Ginsengibacter sp.]